MNASSVHLAACGGGHQGQRVHAGATGKCGGNVGAVYETLMKGGSTEARREARSEAGVRICYQMLSTPLNLSL